jgi:ethanolamine utilization protein EutN
MQVALVVGTATSTVKHPSMAGWKLLIVQPYAVDALGAGGGERVLITSDGKTTRELLKSDTTPVRWSVIGLEDA